MIEGVYAKDTKGFDAYCNSHHGYATELALTYFRCNKITTILVDYQGHYEEE